MDMLKKTEANRVNVFPLFVWKFLTFSASVYVLIHLILFVGKWTYQRERVEECDRWKRHYAKWRTGEHTNRWIHNHVNRQTGEHRKRLCHKHTLHTRELQSDWFTAQSFNTEQTMWWRWMAFRKPSLLCSREEHMGGRGGETVVFCGRA